MVSTRAEILNKLARLPEAARKRLLQAVYNQKVQHDLAMKRLGVRSENTAGEKAAFSINGLPNSPSARTLRRWGQPA